MPTNPDPTGPGQENVWSFPRPAIAQPCERHVRAEHAGLVIAESRRTVRTLETSHPPSYYFPREEVMQILLRPSRRRSVCEWKGEAVYFHLIVAGQMLANIAWSYPDPNPDFEILRDHVAFYAGPLDDCFVDGERVEPQPGGFYGGWITSHVTGPFKGVPGSQGW